MNRNIFLVIGALVIASQASARERLSREEKALLRYEKWRVTMETSGTGSPQLYMRERTLSHWEFAERYSDLTGEPIPEDAANAFNPPMKFRRWPLYVGYPIGGVFLAVGLPIFFAGFRDPVPCPSNKPQQDSCNTSQSERNDQILGGGVVSGIGLALVGMTATYHTLANRALPEHTPFFDAARLQAMVERYNSALRKKYGLTDNADSEIKNSPRPDNHTPKSQDPDDDIFDEIEKEEGRHRSQLEMPAQPTWSIAWSPFGLGIRGTF